MAHPLIWIVVAAGGWLLGKSLGKDEEYKEGHKDGYYEGLRRKVIIQLGHKCSQEFKDRVKTAKLSAIRAEDRAIFTCFNSSGIELGHVQVQAKGVGKVIREGEIITL